MNNLSDIKLAVIGLGYVGLPLAVEFGKRRTVVGFDISEKRITDLQSGQDHTLEVEPEEFQQARLLTYTNNPEVLKACNCYIITVPTPIDEHKRPDLTHLLSASETIGRQ